MTARPSHPTDTLRLSLRRASFRFTHGPPAGCTLGHGVSVRRKAFLVSFLAACGGSESHEQAGANVDPISGGATYSSHEPALGKGTNEEETRTRRTCVVFPAVESQTIPFQGREFDEFSVTSRSQLHHKLGISANVAAKGLWGSASASAGMFKELEIDENAFYWVVHAKYELAHESLATGDPAFDLTEQAKQILRDHGWSGFREACGSHFYAGRRLGARYTLIYEFKDTQDRFVKNISAKASGSLFGIVGGSVDFADAVKTAKSRESMSIHSSIAGGDFSIGDYAESPDKLRQELEKLRESLGRRRQGVALRWHKLPYDIFAEVQAAKKLEDISSQPSVAVDDVLAEMYDRFETNREKSVHLRRARNESQGSEPLVIYSDLQLAEMHKHLESLRAQNVEIEMRARKCIERGDAINCSLEGLEFLSVDIPQPLRDLSGLGKWSVYFYPDTSFYGHDSTFLNIIAVPPHGQGLPRHYKTRHKILQLPDEQVYAYAGKGRVFSGIGHGRMHMPYQGVDQIAVCTGAASHLCSLRFVERKGFTADGLPEADLLLTIYDDEGQILHKNYFQATEA